MIRTRSFALRVVHLGRTTCHAISGRGGSNICPLLTFPTRAFVGGLFVYKRLEDHIRCPAVSGEVF